MATISRLFALAALLVVATACSDDSGSAAGLCAAVGDGSGFATTFEGFDPTDPDRALEQLRAARVSLGALQDVAPGEVRDDLSVQIDYVQALIDALEQADPTNPGEAVREVQDATEAHPEVQAATDRLAKWQAENCTDDASVTTVP